MEIPKYLAISSSPLQQQTHNENRYFGIVLKLTSMYLCFDVVALLAPSNKVVGKHSWSRGSIAGIEPISLRAGWPGAQCRQGESINAHLQTLDGWLDEKPSGPK